MTDLDNYVWKGGNTTRGVARRGGRGRKPAYPKGTITRLTTITLSADELSYLASLGGVCQGVRKLIKAHRAPDTGNTQSWDDA